jgi:hypothetical protein
MQRCGRCVSEQAEKNKTVEAAAQLTTDLLTEKQKGN